MTDLVVGAVHRWKQPAAWVAGLGLLLLAGKPAPARQQLPENAPAGASRRLTIPLQVPATAKPIARLEVQDRATNETRVVSLSLDELRTPPDWQVVIYVDAPLSTPNGFRQAIRVLSREADRLTDLGPTEIVLADPGPRLVLEGSTDPDLVREALRDLPHEALHVGELQWLRQRYSQGGAAEEDSYTTRALAEEVALLDQHRAGLLRRTTQRSGSGPRLLVLVHNGYDLNPRAYYDHQAAATFLEDPQRTPSLTALNRTIAAEGWTAINLALGPEPGEFADPRASMKNLSRATGGKVIRRGRDLGAALDRIRRWSVVSLEVPLDLGPGPHPLTVVDPNSGRVIETIQWASTTPSPLAPVDLSAASSAAGQPALRLLRPEGIALAGMVRFSAVPSHRGTDRVVFLLDGIAVAETTRSPHAVDIDLGPEPRPHTVSAVAYSRSGRQLGEDAIELSPVLQPPTVTISALTFHRGSGRLSLAVESTASADLEPSRLEVYLNNDLVKTLHETPFETELVVDHPDPTDIIRVLAHFPDGQKAEAARMATVNGPAEILDVNLVELVAVVTSSKAKGPIELERDDFRIRQRHRRLPVEHFAPWDDLPLTLGLVLDTSASMAQLLEDAREAGERFFAQAVSDRDQAFVVDFNNRPRLAEAATSNPDELRYTLVGLDAHGYTALYDAIVFALQQFEDRTGRRALVVLTDGEDSASSFQPEDCIQQATIHGVPIYVIILGSPPEATRKPWLLRDQAMARRTGGEIFYTTDPAGLSRIYERIVHELQRQFTIAFNSGRPLTAEELQEIEVEVVPGGLSVRTLLASQQGGS